MIVVLTLTISSGLIKNNLVNSMTELLKQIRYAFV